MVDIRIAVKQFASTHNATIDITDAAVFGGATPKAFIILGGNAGSSQSVETAVGRVLVGWGVASNQFSVSGSTSDNNFARTFVERRMRTDTTAFASDTSGIFVLSNSTAFIANGVRLGFDIFTGAGAANYTIIMFGGADFSAAMGTIAPSGVSPVTGSVTGLGLTPDLVMFAGDMTAGATNVSDTNGNGWSYGAATATQNRCLGMNQANDLFSLTPFSTAFYTDACGMTMNPAGTAGYKLTAGTFTSGGFSYAATGGVNPAAEVWGYLAMSFGGNSVALGDTATPTTVSAPAVTGLGFAPGAFLFGAASNIAAGIQTNTSHSGRFSISAAGGITSDFLASGQQFRWNRNGSSGFADSAQMNLAAAIVVPSDTDILGGTIAAMASLDTGGFTLRYSQVSGVAEKLWYVAIQAPQALLPVTAVRETQGFIMMGARTLPPVRETQALAMFGARTLPNMRVTQSALMYGVVMDQPPCLTRECNLWRITRTDGVQLRFTSHNRKVTYQGQVFSPCKSLATSAFQLSSEIGETDNVDLAGIISSSGISEPDLWAGIYDGATVEVYLIGWDGGTPARLLAAGKAGALQYGDTGYKFEVITAGERLQQRPILKPIMANCRYKLGVKDAMGKGCPVNLPARAVTGAVTAVTTPNVFTGARRRVFTDSSRHEAAGFFTFGRITWTSGANAGLGADIKEHSASGTLVFMRPMEFDIQIGDAYSMTPGCNRQVGTCKDKFGADTGNGKAFGGYPYLKGSDDLARLPIVRT